MAPNTGPTDKTYWKTGDPGYLSHFPMPHPIAPLI